MDGFAIGLKRGKRRRGGTGHGISQPRAAVGFGGDDDSDDEKPRAKSVTRVVSTARGPQQSKGGELLKPEAIRSGSKKEEALEEAPREKKSQIARLVEKRRDVERELLGQGSSEGRDGALFHYDVERCPEQVALATYESTPVDGFGAAMLRSMGWKGKKDKDGSGSKDKADDWRPKLRPSRLGLGAKLGQQPTKSTATESRPVEDASHATVGKEEQDREVLKGTQSEDEVSEPQARTDDLDPKNRNRRSETATDTERERVQRVTESHPRKRSRFATGEQQRNLRLPEESHNTRQKLGWNGKNQRLPER